jgi:DNA-binding response OmpR family regulator
MTTYLTDAGFAVETAASGAYGLSRARQLRPAAIILDPDARYRRLDRPRRAEG